MSINKQYGMAAAILLIMFCSAIMLAHAEPGDRRPAGGNSDSEPGRLKARLADVDVVVVPDRLLLDGSASTGDIVLYEFGVNGTEWIVSKHPRKYFEITASSQDTAWLRVTDSRGKTDLAMISYELERGH